MTPQEILELPYRRCVGIVLRNSQGLIFAGQRLDNAQDAWQMPQGGVELEETPVMAAMRELTEETGVRRNLVTLQKESNRWICYDLPHELVPKLWNGRYRGQRQRWFLMDFLGEDCDINIKTKNPEFSKWAWMAPDAIMKRIVDFKYDTYRQVFDEFFGA